jgi:hypothetical protein
LAACFGGFVQRGRIPEDVLSAITAQVLQGLSYLHRYKHTVRAAAILCIGLRLPAQSYSIGCVTSGMLSVTTFFSSGASSERPLGRMFDVHDL